MDKRENAMQIMLQGTNLELTHELRKFVYRKLRDAQRALGDVDPGAVKIEIELEKTTRRHPRERHDKQLYRAEANVHVPGRFIRAEESAMHLEAAIVKMKNTLTRNIRHWRERVIENKRQGNRKAKALAMTEELPASVLADEWEEPQPLPSPYAEYFDPEGDEDPAIWTGVRDDPRDFT